MTMATWKRYAILATKKKHSASHSRLRGRGVSKPQALPVNDRRPSLLFMRGDFLGGGLRMEGNIQG